MFFCVFLGAFLDQFWGGFWPPFWVPFWGLKGPLLGVLLEVSKVDSDHPYTTLKGFYMSKKINKKGGSNMEKGSFLAPQNGSLFDPIFEAFLEVLLKVI